MSEQTRRYRNIVPITCYDDFVPVGMEWIRAGHQYCCEKMTRYISVRLIQDTRLFEPIEEEWPKMDQKYAILHNSGKVIIGAWKACPGDRERLAVGNIFHPETRLNQHGVHIDNVRKLFLLGLKCPAISEGILPCLHDRLDLFLSDWGVGWRAGHPC